MMKDFLKHYLLELCCAYTIISVIGAITNIFYGSETNNANVIVMFASTALVCFVLELHRIFKNLSPLLMILIQFFVSLGLITGMLAVINMFDPISPRGWFEYYRSYIIVYLLGAGLYYYRLFKEAKEQARLIREIQEISNEDQD